MTDDTRLIRQLAREEWQTSQGMIHFQQGWKYRAQNVALSRLAEKIIAAAVEQSKDTRVGGATHGYLAHCLQHDSIVAECAMWAAAYVIGNVHERRKLYRVASFIGQRCEWICFLRDPAIKDSWHLQDTAVMNYMELGMKATIELLQRKPSVGQHWQWQPLSQAERCALGVFYLDVIRAVTGWWTVKTFVEMKRKFQVMELSEEYRSYLRDYSRATRTVARPVHLPMVARPVPFAAAYDDGKVSNPDGLYHKAGYLSLRCPASSVDVTTWPDHVRKTKPWLWEALNKIQDTGMQINPHMHDTFMSVWDKGIAIGSLPARDPMEEPRHKGLDREHERQMFLWRRDHAKDSLRGLAMSFAQSTNELMGETMHLPVHLDHRGRVYTRGSSVNYLASDWIRQALDFEERVPVKGNVVLLENAIVSALGGGHGVDRDHVMAVGADPMQTISLWKGAKEPWRYMRLCREFFNFSCNPGYHTGCMFPLDQTTSGYGHLAMLTRDARLARLSNCTGASGSEKLDLYMKISTLAEEENRSAIYCEITEPKELQAAIWCRDNWPHRAVVKKVVMPAIYGASYLSAKDVCLEYVSSRVTSQVVMDGLRVSDIATYMASLLFATIKTNLPHVTKLAGWLKVVGKEFLNLGDTLHWYTPSGLKVRSWQSTRPQQEITLCLSGRKIRVTPSVTDHGERRVKPTIGRHAAVDFIHSFDAAFLGYAVASWHGSSIAVAHDSFAVPLNQLTRLKLHLNESWARFYETDYLTRYHGYASMIAGDKIPPPPVVGDLDMSLVGQGDHLFT